MAARALSLPPIAAPTVWGNRLLRWTIGVSLLAHAVLLSIHFKLPDLIKKPSITPPLEVTLVNAKTRERPTKADKLAQANLDGGGNTDAARQLQSPLPRTALSAERTQIESAKAKSEQMERESRELMTQLKARQSSAQTQQRNDAAVIAANAELQQRLAELQRLEAQIARDLEAYQQRPKKKHIGARTEEYRFARYVEDWRLKIEKVGNENYPQDAKTNKLYGSLILTVGIKADGSVDSVEIDKGSGRRVLDTGAMRIVRLSAPFAPFPADIRADTDILYITRTWSFTREDGLATQ